jgi:hypothetical protein
LGAIAAAGGAVRDIIGGPLAWIGEPAAPASSPNGARTTLTPVDPDEGVQAVAACCRFVKASGRF